MTSDNELFRHSIKAIRYRFLKSTEGSKEDFGKFKVAPDTRTPNEIINHMCDLIIKANKVIKGGDFNCPAPDPLAFNEERERLLNGLKELEATTLDTKIEMGMMMKLMQGPILDTATHVGQISMLNGINGNKIKKESYYVIDLG